MDMRGGYRFFLCTAILELLIIGFCILRAVGPKAVLLPKADLGIPGFEETSEGWEVFSSEEMTGSEGVSGAEDASGSEGVSKAEEASGSDVISGAEDASKQQSADGSAILQGEEPVVRIRLTVSDYSGEYHSQVTITCADTFSLTTGGKSQIFTGGQTVSIGPDHPFFAEGSIRVASEGGLLQIDSIAHRNQVNTYPGELELYRTESGIVIINELKLEAYVERVVPSEMPYGYGEEAAKLQAVCARTYAYERLSSGETDGYGAIADDSVEYQVYNASPEREVSTAAAQATRGIILTYAGVPLTPYYFSTSCGFNTDNTVWGGEKLPYLRTQNLSYRGDINLQSEEAFDTFIMDWGYPAYEDDCTWYRWNYTISLEELRNILPERVSVLYGQSPGHFRAENQAGEEIAVDCTVLHDLTSVAVTARLSGGMVGEVAFFCKDTVIYTDGEMILRKLLGSPARIYSNRSAEGFGESEGNYLPSAFFCFSPVYEGETLVSYTICGGGNGHGIGLSQNAAYKMLQSGLTWEEVLQFFYLGTSLDQIY